MEVGATEEARIEGVCEKKGGRMCVKDERKEQAGVEENVEGSDEQDLSARLPNELFYGFFM